MSLKRPRFKTVTLHGKTKIVQRSYNRWTLDTRCFGSGYVEDSKNCLGRLEKKVVPLESPERGLSTGAAFVKNRPLFRTDRLLGPKVTQCQRLCNEKMAKDLMDRVCNYKINVKFDVPEK